jgi:hypothetical protein
MRKTGYKLYLAKAGLLRLEFMDHLSLGLTSLGTFQI